MKFSKKLLYKNPLNAISLEILSNFYTKKANLFTIYNIRLRITIEVCIFFVSDGACDWASDCSTEWKFDLVYINSCQNIKPIIIFFKTLVKL